MSARILKAAMSIALYIGLNPALQRRIDLNKLAVGSVNRAESSSSGIGGKGQGAYVAALQLYAADQEDADLSAMTMPELCMFLGTGREGDALAEFLMSRAGLGPVTDVASVCLPKLWIRVASSCRICTTLVDSETGDATEIVEPSGKVSQNEWEALLAALETSKSEVTALGILGSTPPGVPKDGYAKVLQCACTSKTKVLVDSVVDVFGTLRTAARCVHAGDDDSMSKSGGVLLKLNAREILKLTDQELVGSDSQVAANPDKVATACLALAAKVAEGGNPSVDYICWTDGPFPGGALAVRSGRRWRLERSQELRAPVISPIGAGDSTSAGTLHAWSRGGYCTSPGDSDADLCAVESFRFGLAVGAASCLTGENALFDMSDVWAIYNAIVVTELLS